MKPEISPFHYPTNIALIDDNEAFLNTLYLHLKRFFSCQLFTNPLNALAYANSFHKPAATLHEGLIKQGEYYDGSWVKSALCKQVENKTLNELSVIVVDYDMPRLNGIEFCSRIKNPAIRKILLTGCASYQDVVRAFNDNTIDYYIEKQSDDLLDAVREGVIEMQRGYFCNSFHKLTMSLVENEAPYFLDAAFADFFDETCSNLGAQEHYFMSRPSRFILRCGMSETMLLVLSDEDIEEHIKVLRDEEAPVNWIEQLESRQYIPFFNSSDGFYTPEQSLNHDPMIQASVVCGEKNYYCAIVHGGDDKAPSHLIHANTSGIVH